MSFDKCIQLCNHPLVITILNIAIAALPTPTFAPVALQA